MKKIITEICADSINSVFAAKRGGGDRIELCQALPVEGLSPSLALISECCKNLSIPIFVLIRPRPGDFYYNRDEYRLMLDDIRFCKEAGAAGIVTGFLNPDGSVDKIRLAEVTELAAPMQVTFHRAFDRCRDWESALEDIIDCGCSRILTSGLHNTASEGKDIIRRVVARAGNRIKIMAGSGISPDNVVDIINYTGCEEVHFSAKRAVKGEMTYINPNIGEDIFEKEGISHYESSADVIKKIIENINKAF